MAAGQLDGMTAFMTGKLKVEGDMSNAMQLQGVLAKLKELSVIRRILAWPSRRRLLGGCARSEDADSKCRATTSMLPAPAVANRRFGDRRGRQPATDELAIAAAIRTIAPTSGGLSERAAGCSPARLDGDGR